MRVPPTKNLLLQTYRFEEKPSRVLIYTVEGWKLSSYDHKQHELNLDKRRYLICWTQQLKLWRIEKNIKFMKVDSYIIKAKNNLKNWSKRKLVNRMDASTKES